MPYTFDSVPTSLPGKDQTPSGYTRLNLGPALAREWGARYGTIPSTAPAVAAAYNPHNGGSCFQIGFAFSVLQRALLKKDQAVLDRFTPSDADFAAMQKFKFTDPARADQLCDPKEVGQTLAQLLAIDNETERMAKLHQLFNLQGGQKDFALTMAALVRHKMREQIPAVDRTSGSEALQEYGILGDLSKPMETASVKYAAQAFEEDIHFVNLDEAGTESAVGAATRIVPRNATSAPTTASCAIAWKDSHFYPLLLQTLHDAHAAAFTGDTNQPIAHGASASFEIDHLVAKMADFPCLKAVDPAKRKSPEYFANVEKAKTATGLDEAFMTMMNKGLFAQGVDEPVLRPSANGWTGESSDRKQVYTRTTESGGQARLAATVEGSAEDAIKFAAKAIALEFQQKGVDLSDDATVSRITLHAVNPPSARKEWDQALKAVGFKTVILPPEAASALRGSMFAPGASGGGTPVPTTPVVPVSP